MRVLHIRPPKIMGALERSMVQHPINLLYLAAAVRESGQEPEIWDFEVERFSEKEVKRRARIFRPGLAGATGLTANIKVVAKIMSWIKEVSPGTFTVAGGSHGTAVPERTLKEFPAMDAVVIGEGEDTWRELADRLDRGDSIAGVRGLAWRDGEDIVLEPPRPLILDLDKLAMPARDLIDHSLYKGASSPGLDATLHRSTELFSTRGCPERCIFCAAKVTFGKTIRFRSAKNLLAEVDECMEKWGYRHFTIEDDTFTYRPTRLEEICKGLKERGITWDCDTRVNLINKEMLFMMADCGCQKVAFGVESGSPRILEKLEKDITIDQVKNAFKWAHQASLITTAFFIIGFPGTELERIMRERNLISSDQWEKYTHIHSVPCWRTEHFSAKELVSLQSRLFRQFFLRPHFVGKTLRKAVTWNGLRYYTRSMLQILEYLFIEKRN
jgi:radical SAM superfamily enzyme YgiQ (UPF0313 family)